MVNFAMSEGFNCQEYSLLKAFYEVVIIKLCGRWRQEDPLTCWYLSTKVYVITFQKTVILMY
jgi:hypothetical protein